MRFATKRCSSGWTVRSSVAAMYQLGFDRHATPSTFCVKRSGTGTAWVAQTTFCSVSGRSPAKHPMPSGFSQIRPSATSMWEKTSVQNRMDVAILRRETQTSGLAFRLLIKEPLVVILPANHRLAKHKTIRPQELARESFIAGSTKLAPVLRSTVKEYAAKVGITLNQKYDAENISGGMSLVASTGSVTLLPLYVTNML